MTPSTMVEAFLQLGVRADVTSDFLLVNDHLAVPIEVFDLIWQPAFFGDVAIVFRTPHVINLLASYEAASSSASPSKLSLAESIDLLKSVT